MIGQRSIAMLVLLFLLFTGSGKAQLDSSYLEDIKKSPKSFTLEIVEQKRTENTVEIRKITRYELELNYSLISSQVVYDTMSGVAYNKKVSYTYSDDIDKNLTSIRIDNFNDELVSQTNYEWDSRALLLTKESHIDQNGSVVKTISYALGECETTLLTDLDTKDVSYCETTITKNNYKEYKTIEAYGMWGIVYKWSFKDLDTLSYRVDYFYDEEGRLKKEIKTTASGRKVASVYTYNEQGDISRYTSGYVAFTYDYTYDEKGNWLTKTEVPKNGSIERLFKRSFVYR